MSKTRALSGALAGRAQELPVQGEVPCLGLSMAHGPQGPLHSVNLSGRQLLSADTQLAWIFSQLDPPLAPSSRQAAHG